MSGDARVRSDTVMTPDHTAFQGTTPGRVKTEFVGLLGRPYMVH